MKISEFPQQIADKQLAVLSQEQKVRKLKDILQTFDREIECAVAFDAELKNESQRKSKKAELQADEEYQGTLLELQHAQDALVKLQIEADLLRSQFSVAKLEFRLSLAQLETSIAA
ncbi:MAG TPA: hypothetical protein V6D10_20545 [Trichocoleus sp.]|jgi:hypothetical protein